MKTVEQMQSTLEMLEKKERLLQKRAEQEVAKAKEYSRAKNKSAALACLKKKKLYEQQAGACPPAGAWLRVRTRAQCAARIAGGCCLSRAPRRAALGAMAPSVHVESLTILRRAPRPGGFAVPAFVGVLAVNLANNQMRIHENILMLETAKATTETVSALRAGASQMKAEQKASDINDVDKVMEEINDVTDMQREIQDALGTPVGMAADLDDDELLGELDELEAEDLDDQMMAGVAPAPITAAPAAAAPAMPSVPKAAPVAPAAEADEDAELAALEAEMAL